MRRNTFVQVAWLVLFVVVFLGALFAFAFGARGLSSDLRFVAIGILGVIIVACCRAIWVDDPKKDREK